MRRRELPVVLAIGVSGSLIAAAVWPSTKDLWSDVVGWPLAVGFGLSAAITAGILGLHRYYVRVSNYLSRDRLQSRISRAETEIWSFQISGGDFTVSSVEIYKGWLERDPSRRLKLMFADPDKKGLIKSLVKLGGMGEVNPDDPEAVKHLQDAIRATLELYAKLAGDYPGQVTVRLYDCCPPCSVHAVDATAGGLSASIFVEHYLPGLTWVERPCVLLRPGHRSFRVYRRQCEEWFAHARDVTPGWGAVSDVVA